MFVLLYLFFQDFSVIRLQNAAFLRRIVQSGVRDAKMAANYAKTLTNIGGYGKIIVIAASAANRNRKDFVT